MNYSLVNNPKDSAETRYILAEFLIYVLDSLEETR